MPCNHNDVLAPAYFYHNRMNDVQVIKANRNENRIRGRKVEILRVAAYCRVSTDSEDQLNSYKSQVMYYTDLIKKKPE